MSAQKKKKKKEEKKNPLDDVPAHLRDFIESIALKEQPESPGAMRKKAQLKRKEALENSDETTNIKQMMSGVSDERLMGMTDDISLLRTTSSQTWK